VTSAIHPIPAPLPRRNHATVATTGERDRTSLFAPTRDRMLLLAWVLAACFVAVGTAALVRVGAGYSSNSYWMAWRTHVMYTGVPDSGAYLYSPAFSQLIRPLALLPWPVFGTCWAAASLAALVWLVRPVGWAWGVPLATLALEDIRIGNVVWLLCLVCVVGMRYPVAWVLPMFTKVAPGFIGLAWYAARGRWRAALLVVASSAAVLAVSFAELPGPWREWIALLASTHGVSAPLRLGVAVGLTVWAARRDRPWLLPAALLLSAPVIGLYVLGFACAVPRLLPASALVWANASFGGVRATLRRALDL
jgi:hypothetical protein